MYERNQGTILIISHQERILNIADRIVVIAGGQVRQTGGRELLPKLLQTSQGTCQTLLEKLS